MTFSQAVLLLADSALLRYQEYTKYLHAGEDKVGSGRGSRQPREPWPPGDAAACTWARGPVTAGDESGAGQEVTDNAGGAGWVSR